MSDVSPIGGGGSPTDERMPRLVVAVVLLVLIGVAGIVAIWRYPVDDALKMWAAIGTLFGTLLGSIGTYYFTRQAVVQAEKRAVAAEAAFQMAVASQGRP